MSKYSELCVPEHAANYLASCLRKGELVLFLGSGSSVGFGLPNWVDLVNSIRIKAGLSILDKSVTAQDLQRAADEAQTSVKDKDLFLDIVSNSLYERIPDLISAHVFQNQLLIAISALLMGSKRGHISRVVTLNYDNMLEWFLSLFGFIVKTVHTLPFLEGSEDVRIYHPHGFLPHPNTGSPRSDFLILGMDEIQKRLGTPNSPWFEMTRHLLNTGVCLFIGMSENTLNDYAISPLFNTTGNLVKDKRTLGVWILINDVSHISDFERLNIEPLVLESPSKISEFLLKICQKASESL